MPSHKSEFIHTVDSNRILCKYIHVCRVHVRKSMHVDVHRVHPYYTHNRDLDYTHGVHNMSIIILNNDVHEYSSYTGQICHQRDSE